VTSVIHGVENEASRRSQVIAVAVPAAVMLGLGLWGLDRGGMWGDESVSYLVARRTVPQIWQLLHTVDAVHGLYYLCLHYVLALHPGEVVLRLPSVLGAALAAGLIAALGNRLARPRVGLWAGLLYAVTPMVGHYAQEGRSYALVSAGVAGTTLLLVRALRERRTRVWWAYGGLLALTSVLHELAVLVLLAHGATLALARVPRAVWSGWARGAGAAVLVLLPLVWVSRGQSGQVAWLRTPGWPQVEDLVRSFAVGRTGNVFWGYVLLVAVGVWAGRRLMAVALPLLVLPPATLLLASQIQPLFDARYVLYALAGAPLLAAAGADRLVTAAGRLLPGVSRGPYPYPLVAFAGVLAVAFAFAHGLPQQRADREADHRPENFAAVSAVVARQARPGDAVLFLPAFWRVGALAYPQGFREARDVALTESAVRSGTLSGLEAPPAELRRRLASVNRVWVVAPAYVLNSRRYPSDPTERLKLALVEEHFTPVEDYDSGRRITLGLYVRRSLL